MDKSWQEWIRAATPYFKEALGLSSLFAPQVARLYLELWAAGLNPNITSAFRDPSHQAALRAAWDRGQRQGLRVRPAASSDHTRTSYGRPAAEAVDITTSNERAAGAIAEKIGVGWGGRYKAYDGVHFYRRR